MKKEVLQIANLSDPRYRLLAPFTVTIERDGDYLTCWNEDTHMYGAGGSLDNATHDFWLSIIELYEHLSEKPDQHLGPWMLGIRDFLNSHIEPRNVAAVGGAD